MRAHDPYPTLARQLCAHHSRDAAIRELAWHMHHDAIQAIPAQSLDLVGYRATRQHIDAVDWHARATPYIDKEITSL